MGDLQYPTDGGTLVPYVWPYELWGYCLKYRPKKIGQTYMVSSEKVPEMAIDLSGKSSKIIWQWTNHQTSSTING